MWRDLAPARPVVDERRLLPPALHDRRARARTRGSSSRRAPGTSGSRPTPSATVVAWWDAGSGAGAVRAPAVPPRLGARRRRVRRPARRGHAPWPRSTLLRERGFRPTRPIGVAVFVEEEGSRFGLACLGRGWRPVRVVRTEAACAARPGRRALDEAMAVAGLEVEIRSPGWIERRRASWSCTSSRAATWSTGARPSGWRAAIWPHGRYRFDIAGVAEPRRDDADGGPARPDAHLRDDGARGRTSRPGSAGQRATFGRVEVAPNATNAIPSRVTAWLDARAVRRGGARRAGRASRRGRRTERAERDGTTLTVTAESVSPAVDFDPPRRPRRSRGPDGAP